MNDESIRYSTIPSILVLNKVDRVGQDRSILLKIATSLTAGTVGGEKVAAKGMSLDGMVPKARNEDEKMQAVRERVWLLID